MRNNTKALSNRLKIHIEECRISYLFKIENPVDEESLEHKLIEKKYKINKERIITRPPLQAVILNFARKANIDVLYEKRNIPTFVGVAGKNHNNVVTAFEELKHILESMDAFILEESSEIQAVITCRIFGQSRPENVFPHFATSEIKKFDDKLSKQFMMENFTIKSKTESDVTSIHIAPLYKDERYFYMQLALTSPSLENIFNFVEKHEKYISDIIGIVSNG